MDAAAAQFSVIDNVYVDSFLSISSEASIDEAFETYAGVRSYYVRLAESATRFGTELRAMKFPADVRPDVLQLLQRISEFETLGVALSETEEEDDGWGRILKIQDADSATEAARQVVGIALGLTYGDEPEASTPSPVAVHTATPNVTPAPAPTATSRPPEAFPSGFVAASEAIAYVGQVETVCGVVVGTANVGTTFLNLDQPYPAQVFTIVIWPEDRASFGGAPEDLFLGARVCIEGLITRYEGVAQIVSSGGDVEVYN